VSIREKQKHCCQIQLTDIHQNVRQRDERFIYPYSHLKRLEPTLTWSNMVKSVLRPEYKTENRPMSAACLVTMIHLQDNVNCIAIFLSICSDQNISLIIAVTKLMKHKERCSGMVLYGTRHNASNNQCIDLHTFLFKRFLKASLWATKYTHTVRSTTANVLSLFSAKLTILLQKCNYK